jgi:thymidylate synthase (FAD)
MDRAEQQPGSGAEILIEFAGRACYRSWEPGLNANVTRIRQLRSEYFENLLASGHGSVLEHANFTFVARNVSRVVTHEWVRHRAGAAYSQESLRYVRLTDIGFRMPPALESLRQPVLELVERLEEFQRDAAESLGLDADGVPFAVKKEVTSALRRLAPIGLSTDIVATMNVRTLRHVIAMRTDPTAEEEMRIVFDQVAQICVDEVPELFRDFERSADGTWTPKYAKV